MKEIFQSLLLLIFISASCHSEKQKADLELDTEIKEIIQDYQRGMMIKYEEKPDSIDIFFYEIRFKPACMVLDVSRKYSNYDIPFLVTYVNGTKIRVYSSLRNLFENKTQFFVDNSRTIYENTVKTNEDSGVIICSDKTSREYRIINNKFVPCEPEECMRSMTPPIKYTKENGTN